LPETLTETIGIPDELSFYLTAFFDLSSHRPLGFGGEGAIPTMAVFEYGRWFDFTLDELEDLLFYVRRLDNVYLEHINKKQTKKK